MAYSVSVITAVFNNMRGLTRTLDSVRCQTYRATEHIVIDGGSNDGSVDLLRGSVDGLSYWVSEPDSGIAEAMNKGLSAARGDLVLFLHSDDFLPDSRAIERCVSYVDDLSAIWAFDVYFGREGGLRRVHPRPLNWWASFRNPLPHQGVLCPQRVFERLGRFDQSLSIEMDYDLWLRAMKDGVRLVRVPEVLAVMGGGGISSRRDWRGLTSRLDEERLVHKRHAQTPAKRAAYAAFWPLYRAYRRAGLSVRHCLPWEART